MVTQAATLAAGRSHSIDPVQAVEWMMADISCMVTDSGVEPTAMNGARSRRLPAATTGPSRWHAASSARC